MEPKLQMPSSSPELSGYHSPEVPVVPSEKAEGKHVESKPQSSGERQEVQQQTPSDPIVVPAVPAQVFLPTPTQQAPQSAPTQPIANTPLAASDDDLIEKEWVEKAKQIIQETKSDPYRQEKEVSKLQADYIKKRYGKDVKLASE